jgi:FSR family fosmidomycin resistance protein-like MFS transporter
LSSKPSVVADTSLALDAPLAGDSIAQPRSVTRVTSGLLALAFGHLAVDSCTGIWPVYKTIAHLDLNLAGAIATFAGMMGNGLQLGFGFLGDRGLARALLVGGVLLSSAATFVPYAGNYAALFALVLATSIGSAAFHPIGAGAAASLSRNRAGVLMALFLAGGYVGYSMSQFAFTAVYRSARGGTALISIVPALAALGIWRFVPSAPKRRPTLSAWTRSLRDAARPLGALFAVQAFASTLNISLVFLLPDFLLQRHAPAWVAEGGGHFAFVLGGALALLPAGHASDRLGGRRVLMVMNLLTGLLLGVILWVDLPPLALLPFLAAFGAFNGANNVVAVSEGNRLVPEHNSGVSALLMGMPWCLAALGPAIAGYLADPRRGGHPTAALTWMALCIPLVLAAAALVPARGPEAPSYRGRPN